LNFSVFENFTFALYTRDLKKKKNYKKLQYIPQKNHKTEKKSKNKNL